MTKKTEFVPLMKALEKIFFEEQLKEELETENNKFFIDKHAMIIDLTAMMKDYFIGTFKEDGQSIEVTFTNGQKFKITVENCE